MNEGDVGIQGRLREIALNALRIVFGLMFMQHGAQKLFGLLGAQGAAEFPSQFWWAGVLESFGGLLIVIGAFTRPVAFILASEMAVAFFQAHLPRGWVPIMNGGELAVLFCFAWLHLAASGGGSFSVDGLLAARRRPT
jgi:putative oxidoreductase